MKKTALLSGLLAILIIILTLGCDTKEEDSKPEKEKKCFNDPDAPVDYMIITADGLAAEAEAIRAYRKSTCYVTGLITMSEIIAGMAGTDIEEELKMRIRSIYELRDPERPFFVLLVGDAEETPSKRRNTRRPCQ